MLPTNNIFWDPLMLLQSNTKNFITYKTNEMYFYPRSFLQFAQVILTWIMPSAGIFKTSVDFCKETKEWFVWDKLVTNGPAAGAACPSSCILVV